MKRSVIVLVHIGYWLMYLLMLTLFTIPFIMQRESAHVPIFMAPILKFWGAFALVPGTIGFYSFYFFLFSRFFSRKKILYMFLSGIGISILCGFLGASFFYIHFNGQIFPNNNGHSEDHILILLIAFNALANGAIGLVLRGFITSYGDIKLKEDLNKKNYETELALIKSQINPHFLFNTLNNIDVLIRKDAVRASLYLNKLSDIMRFMLYEAKTEKIPLEKELSYIEKYIELQKIRTSNLNYVNYSVTGSPDGIYAEPMLFIPFIENAFKHAENKKAENAIRICFVIEKDKIIFECENNYPELMQKNIEYGGLGNELIRKRMMLLYPGKHVLTIQDQNGLYTVHLVIELL